MSPEEIEKTVVEKIREMGITDKASAGKLIGVLMRELVGALTAMM